MLPPARLVAALAAAALLLPTAGAFLLPLHGSPRHRSAAAPAAPAPPLAAAAAAGDNAHNPHNPHDAVPMSTLGAGLSVAEALDMIMGLDRPSVADYNLALAACAREKRHEEACWLVEEIAEWGLTPDRTSYALAIEACAPAGMVEEARHLLSCMKDAEHELDVEVYGHVAMACERAKNWRQLMWTFDEMQLRDLVPSLSRYNSAIRGCTQEGEWQMAVSLVLEADRRGLRLDRESFETALGAVASAKQPARALDLLKAMREAGAGKPEQGVLSGLVGLCRELGEDGLAEELLRDFGPLM